ncbi:MAG: c-type cytochrome [Candidatus Puniceispirillaceae bacterium]
MPVRTFLSAALLATVSMAASLPAAADVIEERKANFKANNMSMRAMGAALGANDFAVITAEAQKIADWAAVMPDYFPESSSSGNTSAKAAIWEDFDAFMASAKANHEAALMLIAAAEAEDMTATKNALGQLGGSCKACHQQFKGW